MELKFHAYTIKNNAPFTGHNLRLPWKGIFLANGYCNIPKGRPSHTSLLLPILCSKYRFFYDLTSTSRRFCEFAQCAAFVDRILNVDILSDDSPIYCDLIFLKNLNTIVLFIITLFFLDYLFLLIGRLKIISYLIKLPFSKNRIPFEFVWHWVYDMSSPQHGYD